MSNETGRLLVILTPGGFEDRIQTIRDSPADKVQEVAARYGCFNVGQTAQQIDLLGFREIVINAMST